MLMVVHDGSLPFTKGFRSACCTKFRFLSSLAYLLQSSKKPFDVGAADLEGDEEPSGGIVLRQIQDPRIANSSGRNQSTFLLGFCSQVRSRISCGPLADVCSLVNLAVTL